MYDLKGIAKVMKKLKKGGGPGEIKYEPGGRKEIRYSYYLHGEMAFTFGLTRSSTAKSKKYYYLPENMGITNGEYRKLHDCPWKKIDLNQKLIESDVV
jgi:hypothetical protein